jgi:excisionase family DNA binding protein
MEKMSPERIVQLLKCHGVTVTIGEAKVIVDFLESLAVLASKIDELNILQKPVLNFDEACRYLHISPSHLYKLTSQKQIPHFCPQGKKLYFKREEIDNWLLRNRQSTADEIDHFATDYIIRKKRGR